MQNKKGFTLIEIMVVVLIVSITLGLALLAFGDFGSQRRVVMAAEQFINYVTFVEQIAILETSTLGIRVNQHGYQVLHFQSSKNWQAMPNKSRFHQQFFPDNAIIRFTNQTSKTGEPQIVINSSGDITPFSLNFSTKSQANIVNVVGRHDGTVKLEHLASS